MSARRSQWIRSPATRGARGFTLMEVLIAVFVLGIGLLGVAGLQSIALSMNAQSSLRTKATFMADDIADRMRANYSDLAAYDMGDGASPSENTSCESAGTGCLPPEMAQHDLYEWRQEVADELPQGVAIVCRDSTPDDGSPGDTGSCDGNEPYAAKLWWYDKELDEVKRFVTSFRAQNDLP